MFNVKKKKKSVNHFNPIEAMKVIIHVLKAFPLINHVDIIAIKSNSIYIFWILQMCFF